MCVVKILYVGSKKRPVNQFSSHSRVKIFYGKLSGRCVCSEKEISRKVDDM